MRVDPSWIFVRWMIERRNSHALRRLFGQGLIRFVVVIMHKVKGLVERSASYADVLSGDLRWNCIMEVDTPDRSTFSRSSTQRRYG